MESRLSKLIRIKGLTASGFADELGVQRSGISHILNGRNKPSLDLLEKILRHFPEISPDWLILGKGEPLRGNDTESLTENDSDLFPGDPEKTTYKKKGAEKAPGKNIDKIVVFYSDNTFEEYTP
jgi:transcriptional regulator with XRE-family HTH domain